MPHFTEFSILCSSTEVLSYFIAPGSSKNNDVESTLKIAFMSLSKSMKVINFGDLMPCTLPKTPDFSEPLISKAYQGSSARETQHVAV